MKILPNGIAVIDGDEGISKWIEKHGRLDHDQWLLKRVLPYIPEGGVVVDGGAFIGDHTVAYAAKVGLTGTVHAMEPNPIAFECLKHNTKNLPQVKRYGEALTHHESTVWIEPNPNSGATRITLKQDPFATSRGGEPLDRYQLETVHFIKLDLEGFECEALLGAWETIKRCRPVMLIEVNEGALEAAGSSSDELLGLLTVLRYSFDNILNEPMTGPQFDILCKPL